MTPTWMAREIDETPAVVARLLDEGRPALAAASAAIHQARPRWVSFVARGTSHHVGTYGRYLTETTLGIPTMSAAASVTTVYDARLAWSDGVLIAVSQSGRSPDLIAVVEAARAGGARTIAITNDPQAPLAEAADIVVPVLAGVERAVVATKTYVASLVAMAAVIQGAASRPGSVEWLAALPDVLRRVIPAARRALESSGLVDAMAAVDRAMVTSRGYDLPTALEVALKLQEAAGIAADGMSSADLEHGPIALAAAPGMEVVAFRPDGTMGRRVDGALDRLRASGARPWVIGGQEAPIARDQLDGARQLQLPVDVPAELSPALLVVPGQLLTEAVARARGLDPDAPVGLTKVTRTH